MSMPRCAGAALVAMASVMSTARAQAQTPAYAASTASHADTALDPSVAREIEIARARGVPAEPLFAKVREGRLKRATPPRIRTAVAALATRLDSARAALGPAASAEELIAGADALSAGADATAVRAVRAASLGRPMSAPLGALTQLLASGVPPARAVALIVDLMRRQATAAQVVAFGNSVEADAAGGLPAEEAARFRWREFGTNTGPVNSLAGDAAATAPGSNQWGTSSSSPPTKPPRRRP
jgi:hypothetical protein